VVKIVLDDRENLVNFVKENVLGASEVMEILGCSNQYVHQLVKEGKLKPIKQFPRFNFFLKSDVEALKKPPR
jgi:predicted DNA-binding transcriptional regulator AlpA